MENTIDKSNVTDIWKMPFILTVMAVVYLLLLYYPTTLSTVAIWSRSDTFAHGFLIFPISIWLIWQQRKQIMLLTPSPIIWFIPLVGMFSVGWLVAHYVDVLIIQQLALYAMIPAIVFTMLGWQVTKNISFPLFFLIFAVPMGEELVPGMVEFTANFTVAMVKLVGIPIYREGNYFELPSGNWSVVEACSGVRYLIASITLGFIYAYLNYQKFWKRFIFILVSILVPIVANGLRAFMIVMIGHYSDMQLATGIDHLIYGWIFFGIVIMIVFYIGSFWREERVEDVKDCAAAEVIEQEKPKKLFIVFIALILMISVTPMMAYLESQSPMENLSIELAVPQSDLWQREGDQLTAWHPQYSGVDSELLQTYHLGGDMVGLYIGYYAKQRQGAELITSTNLLVNTNEHYWRSTDKGKLKFDVKGKKAVANKAIVRSDSQELLVAYYYVVDRSITTNKYITKLREAKARLLGGDKSASIVSVVTPVANDVGRAEKVLQNFLETMDDPIRSALGAK